MTVAEASNHLRRKWHRAPIFGIFFAGIIHNLFIPVLVHEIMAQWEMGRKGV